VSGPTDFGAVVTCLIHFWGKIGGRDEPTLISDPTGALDKIVQLDLNWSFLSLDGSTGQSKVFHTVTIFHILVKRKRFHVESFGGAR
jgi:hypothetical protein